MPPTNVRGLAAFLLPLALAGLARADGRYVEVSYPASDKPGELRYAVNFTLWLPPEVKTIRGVIVHQHGCGSGACKGGETAAYDLHWQALARRWDCALLGPRYFQEDKQDCRLWCDPRNGSGAAFLRALSDLARKAEHPEIDRVPWCLWGHSGGGFWASLMQTAHPERIVAIWFRSGTAFATWEKGEIPKPTIPPAAYGIPMMLNPGAKEKGDKRFNGAWTGAMDMFKAYRGHDAPVGFAPDPRTAHECGDSRYLAIPFFDACLEMRLPAPGAKTQGLRPVNRAGAWLAPVLATDVTPAASFKGDVHDSVWLPDERVARAWAEYVKTGAVSDRTPPPPPGDVKASTRQGNRQIELNWSAVADLESGLQGFVIRRDGKELARVPEKPVGRFGRPLFQPMSYHDTPEKLPAMTFVDTAPGAGTHEYEVIAVNGVGLLSKPAKISGGEK